MEVIFRMVAVDELDRVLEQFQLAGNEFMKGNPKPVQDLFSHREDVTLANPFGPPVRGWEHVAATQERGASYYRDGEVYDFETVAKYVTPELACVVWLERTNAKWRKRRCYPMRSAGYDGPSPRGRYLEGSASPRGPHNHCSASRIGDTELNLRSSLLIAPLLQARGAFVLDRATWTSDNAIQAKFAEFVF